MFKTLVTKLAKDAWDNAGKADPKPAPQPNLPAAHAPEPAQPEVMEPHSVETDIEFPYYPGEGTTCGTNCRCRWQVEVRWSDEQHSKATFATWKTAGDGDVCPECQERADAWQDVMIRLEPGD
jgi:hypothetical protein